MITPKVDNVKKVDNPDFNRNADDKKKKKIKKMIQKREKLKNGRYSTTRFIHGAIAWVTCFTSS